MDIAGFTKKMLDVFPTLKDEYKAHITKYGNFLYLNFFGEYLVPVLKNLFETLFKLIPMIPPSVVPKVPKNNPKIVGCIIFSKLKNSLCTFFKYMHKEFLLFFFSL